MPERLGPWKGVDIVTGESVTLRPNEFQFVPITLPYRALPGRTVDSERIATLSSSGQSRLAQIGVVVSSDTPRYISDSIRERGLDGFSPTRLPAVAKVYSYFTHVQIDKGAPLGRLYRPGAEIVSEELDALINAKKIRVEGRQGVAWDYLYRSVKNGDDREHVIKKPEYIDGIIVRIEGKRLIIPPTELIKASDIQQALDYRPKIDKHLKPAEASSKTQLWIGNTNVVLGMDDEIDAVIDEEVYSSISSAKLKEGFQGRHINARLLDGGKDWQIRVEVLGPIVPGKDSFIILRFRRNRLFKAD